MHSLVVHCKQDPYDVLIDRSTMWGNPFIVGRDGDRATVVEKYRTFISEDSVRARYLRGKLHELRGKVLGCWCAPRACHGEVLAELANA